MEAILAIEQDGGIGFDNIIPWYVPEDLKHFKKVTMGKFCVMGRNTFKNVSGFREYPEKNSILLPGRKCAVVTTNALHVNSDVELIDLAKVPHNAMIIGGIKLIEALWDNIETFYLTKLNLTARCDTFLDMQKFDKTFSLFSEKITDTGDSYGTYHRRN